MQYKLPYSQSTGNKNVAQSTNHLIRVRITRAASLRESERERASKHIIPRPSAHLIALFLTLSFFCSLSHPLLIIQSLFFFGFAIDSCSTSAKINLHPVNTITIGTGWATCHPHRQAGRVSWYYQKETQSIVNTMNWSKLITRSASQRH